ERVLGRRHASWPVARGLGNPRRPALRPLHRSVPDGNDQPAKVSFVRACTHKTRDVRHCPRKRTSGVAFGTPALCQQATSRGTGVLAEARYSCQAGCEATARGSVMLLVLISL